jgi:hypothetical protein
MDVITVLHTGVDPKTGGIIDRYQRMINQIHIVGASPKENLQRTIQAMIINAEKCADFIIQAESSRMFVDATRRCHALGSPYFSAAAFEAEVAHRKENVTKALLLMAGSNMTVDGASSRSVKESFDHELYSRLDQINEKTIHECAAEALGLSYDRPPLPEIRFI